MKLWHFSDHSGDQRYKALDGIPQTIAEIRDMKLWHSLDHSGNQRYETLALLRP
jgi:hypothetical protein